MAKLLFVTFLLSFSSSVVFTADSGMSSPEKQTDIRKSFSIEYTVGNLIENASKEHVTIYNEKGEPYNLFERLCTNCPVNRKHNGTTALHEAAKAGIAANVRMLLFHSANPNATDEYGQTPYHRARLSGNENSIEQLRGVGAERFAQRVAPFSERPLLARHSLK